MNYKKILFIIIFVGILLALLFWSIYYSLENEVETSLEIQRKSQQTLQEIVEKRVLYVIKKGEGEILQYQIAPVSDSTVFALLEDLSQKKDFKISYKIYPEMGVFVESIDGLENGTDGKYWQYWVNGELPMVAANNSPVKEGDIVEWKFETSQF